MPTYADLPDGVEITGPLHERYDEVLTPGALTLLATLHRAYDARRRELLAGPPGAPRRDRRRRRRWTSSPRPRTIREDETWRVADPAPGLEDRRVEITGPTDRKMTINALNSGAKVWLADFEDANTPAWENMVGGQLNLRDAIERRIDFTSPEGKSYALHAGRRRPTVVVRPRGWHLNEKHLLVDGAPVSGALVDFGLYFFHNAPR